MLITGHYILDGTMVCGARRVLLHLIAGLTLDIRADDLLRRLCEPPAVLSAVGISLMLS